MRKFISMASFFIIHLVDLCKGVPIFVAWQEASFLLIIWQWAGFLKFSLRLHQNAPSSCLKAPWHYQKRQYVFLCGNRIIKLCGFPWQLLKYAGFKKKKAIMLWFMVLFKMVSLIISWPSHLSKLQKFFEDLEILWESHLFLMQVVNEGII